MWFRRKSRSGSEDVVIDLRERLAPYVDEDLDQDLDLDLDLAEPSPPTAEGPHGPGEDRPPPRHLAPSRRHLARSVRRR